MSTRLHTRISSRIPKRRRSAPRRGIALIMVLTAIAIFSAVVIDFSYSSRIELDLAANARDEVRAYFLARSAVNLTRLVLHFQKQLDSNPLLSGGAGGLGGLGGLAGLLGGAGGGAGGLAGLLGGAGAGGTTSGSGAGASAMPGAGGFTLRLWELIPIDSGTLQLLLGTGLAPKEIGSTASLFGDEEPSDKPKGPAVDADGKPLRSFGDFSGSFHAEVEDEERKFNISRLDNLGRVMQVAIMQALLIFGDKRYEWLYEEDDAHGRRIPAKEVLINLHDYADADKVAATLNPNDAVNPFAAGFSDEEQPYSSYAVRYKPKNAPFDSLDELYMVDGVNDRWMAAFRNRLTVYADKNRAINVNTDDPFMQLMNIYLVAQNPQDRALQNPATLATILRDIQLAKMFAGMGITTSQFIGIVQGNGIAVDSSLTANLNSNLRVADKSETFTIHAVGEVGKVQKRLTAVVRYDQGLGQLIYWREE